MVELNRNEMIRTYDRKENVIMKFRPIFVDSDLQELTEHGTADFPMSMDEQQVSLEHCGQVLHWHYEIQIAVVTKGSILFKTSDSEFLVKCGQGIFFNSGCLHEAISTEDKNSVYVCVNFHPKLISGHSNSAIQRDYVDPLIFSTKMQVIPLCSADWHDEICQLVLEMARVNDAQQYGYEIELKILLCRIWINLLKNNRPLIEIKAAVTFSEKQRLKTLQNFIHKNYMERISLMDIADTVHISRGECCRIFARILHTTPFRYLINYRISQSLKLLSTTDLSILEISAQTGFGSSSYFTECFKKEMLCTPIEYRKQAKHTKKISG